MSKSGFEFYKVKRAAEQGNADAQFKLGVMYHEGNGVERDFEEAFYWYGEAAKQGCTRAMYGIGMMYAGGEGVEKDFLEAKKWFEKVIESEKR